MYIPAETPMRQLPNGKWEPAPEAEKESAKWRLAYGVDTDKPRATCIVCSGPIPVGAEIDLPPSSVLVEQFRCSDLEL